MSLSTDQPLSDRRPPGVVGLMVFYWLVTPVSLFSWIVASFGIFGDREGAMSGVDLTIVIFDWILRGIGVTRLFMLKANAWLYLLFSLVVGVSFTVMSFVEQAVTGKFTILTLPGYFLGYALLTAIVVYAYKICHSDKVDRR